MPNARGRGRTTQDAHKILTATTDDEAGTITIATAGRPDPMTLAFPVDTLGDQLRHAVWTMIPHAGHGGRWGSSASLIPRMSTVRHLHASLTASGVSGFDDPDLRFGDFLPTRERAGGTWRGFRRAVAWALREWHPEGDRLAEVMLADRMDSTIANPTVAYDEATAALIEGAARETFLAWVGTHRNFIAAVGVDTDDRNWIVLSADAVVEVARSSGSEEARLLLEYVDQGTMSDGARRAIGASRDDLAATAVLMCLAQNLGPNWAALQSMTGKSITPLGEEQAVVDMEKARASTHLRVPTATADLYTLGGIATALRGLTRFVRYRRHIEASSPQHRRHADLLFVPTGARAVLSSPTSTAWARRVGRDIGEPVSMRRLRETANFRGKRETGRGTVIGHSDANDQQYLVEGFPEDELSDLVLGAQHDIMQRSREAVARDLVADEQAVTEKSVSDPDELVDRGVVTCGNGARDPEADVWCNRGILACFTCPSGYRTAANIPGLKAAVTLTERIRAHDTDEWDNGPAATLNAYALAALEQLGPNHDLIDERPMIPVVAANYWEIRA